MVLKVIVILYAIAVLIAALHNSELKRKGLEGIEWIQVFNPIKLFSVLFGFLLSRVPAHVFEQYVLRFYDEDCAPCIENGKCLRCGCDTRAKMWSPLEEDSGDNWGRIIWSKSKYQKLRAKYPVKIKVEYGKDV